jgi:hypothetical protein
MKKGHFLAFVLGLIMGAALMGAGLIGAWLHFGLDRVPQTLVSVNSPSQLMQASVPGLWKGTIEVYGQEVPFSLAVKRTGADLTGVISTEQVGDVPCDQIKIDPAGNISFTAHADDRSATFTGKLAADAKSMAGNLNSSVGPGEWTLAKNKS